MADNEREERELRVEISRLARSKEALEGLAVLGDGWATARLGEIEAAIHEKTGRLTTLALAEREVAK